MASGHNTHTEVPATKDAGGANFPPFEPSSFASQLLWLAICFGALYLFLSRVALPRVATIIEQRSERISRDLDEATRLKEESEKAMVAYDQALAEAKAKAHGIAQETRDALQAEVNQERADVEQQIATKLEEAEARISEAKATALSHVNEVAADTTKALLKKLVSSIDVPEQELNDAINASLKNA